MTRREACKGLGFALLACRAHAAASSVATVIGTGMPGLSDQQVANPYGMAFGPDGALYVCDLDNQRIRRVDLQTRRTSVVAGNGTRGYAGDGGLATAAALNMPHEIQFDPQGHLYIVERDNHAVRRVDARTGVISTLAGTGIAGFSGDDGPAASAQLRSPHSIAVHPDGQRLLICDIGNHRIRSVHLPSGRIETIGGTGEKRTTPDGAPLRQAPLNGPRTIAFDDEGTLYLALREGNAIFRVDRTTMRLHHLAGTGTQGYAGDEGPARLATLGGPKGLAWSRRVLYVADTENHVIRAIDLTSGIIRTALGTGKPGDGPEPEPARCALNRPHGLLADAQGRLYVGDSEAHRIRLLTS